jgi:hypothetical protein
MAATGPPAGFDGHALYAALDAQRAERGLSWPGAAREIWELSAELNAHRNDHPISPATLTGLRRSGRTSCQHALFFLHWLERMPEDFMTGPLTVAGRPLPAVGPDRRLRWHLHGSPRRPQGGLFEAMDARRGQEGLTWGELADRLQCTASQLSGVRRVRYAIGVGLAMRITQWLQRPAADFVYAARW